MLLRMRMWAFFCLHDGRRNGGGGSGSNDTRCMRVSHQHQCRYCVCIMYRICYTDSNKLEHRTATKSVYLFQFSLSLSSQHCLVVFIHTHAHTHSHLARCLMLVFAGIILYYYDYFLFFMDLFVLCACAHCILYISSTLHWFSLRGLYFFCLDFILDKYINTRARSTALPLPLSLSFWVAFAIVNILWTYPHGIRCVYTYACVCVWCANEMKWNERSPSSVTGYFVCDTYNTI